MKKIKILLVEDNQQAIGQFKMNLTEFNTDNPEYFISETIVENYEQALQILDKSYDAIILDLGLNQHHEGGNDIAKNLLDNNIRVPILFVSGNHQNVQKNPLIINVRSRDDGDYENDFKLILNVYQTGLTNILGGRGEIEKKLSDIFLETILPELDIWKTHVANEESKENTEKALLRLVVNHLQHLLEDEDTPSYPEEFYIYPIKDEILRTGTLIKCKTTQNYFISLSPACDLAIRRSGTCNTDRLLIAEINDHDNIKDIALREFSELVKNAETRKKVKSKLEGLYGNN
ncbi:MAG: response regulator transcription factor, partial [Campylobacterales bacterium]|nr:response regulator transcription factor [Campylobacterales bacterium]